MDLENFKKGELLVEKIGELKKLIQNWDNSTEIDLIRLCSASGVVVIPNEYIDFEALRTITVSKMKKELEKLEKEFKEL